MGSMSVLAAAAMSVASLAFPAAAEEPPRVVPRAALDEAIARVYPALVRIHVVAVDYQQGRETKNEAAGSGVVISPAGYVVTNHHVAGKARRLRVTMADKSEVGATLVGTDPLSDIAVIKLEAGDKAHPLPVAAWGDSSSLRVGDTVLAMGSPRAISQSVTLGIVSNVEMTFPSLLWPSTFKLDGEETGSLVKWIGHDAQIQPGNSGGPLVNLKGEIVGINEISFGLGGAIPGNLARGVAEELIRSGRVSRSWLGLELQPRLKGTDKGALVSGVVSGSPAEAAGLRAGDVLVASDGQPVDVRYSEQLPEFNRRLLGTPVGTKIELVFLRDGKEQRATATTVARGAAEGDEAELSDWGVTVQDITLLAAKELEREPASGVLVGSVRPGTAAAEAKPALRPRDIVVDVGGTPVRSMKEARAATARALANHTGSVPVLVAFERGRQRMLTVLKLGRPRVVDRSAAATKAWLPAVSQVLTPDLAEALDLKGQTGVRLTQIYPGSTAAAAGLQVGDVVLKFDGEAIPASRPEDVEVLPAMVRQRDIGARVKLDIVRAGAPRVVEVELAPSPRSTRELVEYHDEQFDFSARDLAFEDRLDPALENEQRGALVTQVESGGWAALAHMAVGDLVLSVDGQPVDTAAALETRMSSIAKARPARVVFLVRRGVHTLFLELEPSWA